MVVVVVVLVVVAGVVVLPGVGVGVGVGVVVVIVVLGMVVVGVSVESRAGWCLGVVRVGLAVGSLGHCLPSLLLQRQQELRQWKVEGWMAHL
jgi:hypothetical protein